MEEEEGRSGVLFLLSSPHEEEEEEEEEEADLREHIASDITQKRWIELPSHRKDGIKDRSSALRMIEDAEEKGLITPGTTTLVEPTSGNLGIALAYIAIRKGYKFITVMPAQYSPDKQIVLRYLGAEVLLTGGELGRHKIQGLGPGFVPQNLEKSQIDEIVMVTSEESMTNARRLAREEGLLVGISSGANLAVCLKVAAREENKGKMIVTMFPSGGERYVSSELFPLAREECTKMTF